MAFLSLIRGLFALGETLAKIAHDRQLLDAGEYKAIALHSQRILDNVKKAQDAVTRAKSNDNIADKLRDRYDLDK